MAPERKLVTLSNRRQRQRFRRDGGHGLLSLSGCLPPRELAAAERAGPVRAQPHVDAVDVEDVPARGELPHHLAGPHVLEAHRAQHAAPARWRLPLPLALALARRGRGRRLKRERRQRGDARGVGEPARAEASRQARGRRSLRRRGQSPDPVRDEPAEEDEHEHDRRRADDDVDLGGEGAAVAAGAGEQGEDTAEEHQRQERRQQHGAEADVGFVGRRRRVARRQQPRTVHARHACSVHVAS